MVYHALINSEEKLENEYSTNQFSSEKSFKFKVFLQIAFSLNCCLIMRLFFSFGLAFFVHGIGLKIILYDSPFSTVFAINRV